MKIRSGFVSNSSSSSFIVELSKPAREYNLGEFISEFNVSSNEIEYAEKLLSELQWKDEEEVDLDDIYIYIDIDTSMLDVETESKLESKYTNLIKKQFKKKLQKIRKIINILLNMPMIQNLVHIWNMILCLILKVQ